MRVRWCRNTFKMSAMSSAEGSDAFFLKKRKEFLAAAGLLYAPVCTPLSRHLLCNFARISKDKAPEETTICSKCNCLRLGGSSHVTIRQKPVLSARIRRLRRRSNSQLTGLERRKLRRWESRSSKVVIYCKKCNQKVTIPGPSSANANIHRKESFARIPAIPMTFQTKKSTQQLGNSSKRDRKIPHIGPMKKDKDKLNVNPANKGKNERKLKHIKTMLKGHKKKADSKSPLLKFLSSL